VSEDGVQSVWVRSKNENSWNLNKTSWRNRSRTDWRRVTGIPLGHPNQMVKSFQWTTSSRVHRKRHKTQRSKVKTVLTVLRIVHHEKLPARQTVTDYVHEDVLESWREKVYRGRSELCPQKCVLRDNTPRSALPISNCLAQKQITTM
jgi:hypothetical protein